MLHKVLSDCRRGDLVAPKVLQFLQTGGLVSIFPFLPLHMKELGLNLNQISTVQTIVCVGDILTPLALSFITVHLANIRPLLVGSICLNILSAIFLATIDRSSNNVFLLYLLSRFSLELSRGSSLNLYESVNLMTVKTRHGDYGIQKIFGSLGGTIMSSVSGYIAHYHSFKSVFYFYSLIEIIFLTVLVSSDLQYARKEEKNQRKSSILDCLRAGSGVTLFLFISCFLGFIWSFSETYVFLHLESVGYSRRDLGFMVATSTIMGVLVSLASTSVLDLIGWRAALAIALGSYSTRLMGYSLIPPQSIVILALLESLKCVGNPWCMLVTGYFIKNQVDLTHIASFQSVFSLLYFGIGKGLGSATGASLIGYLGYRNYFQILSSCSGGLAVYLLYKQYKINKQKEE
eukprot:TRINITY_DN9403_c0_g1_i1.p1 TRINITY_DN9403_c0_g1~~TRINITY_DN9403_c0_g1_i1.p1  ORF type:complete len:403 (+),score=26.38 TRINITY_DN9403_c0_g1_i1:61-1269(+)